IRIIARGFDIEPDLREAPFEPRLANLVKPFDCADLEIPIPACRATAHRRLLYLKVVGMTVAQSDPCGPRAVISAEIEVARPRQLPSNIFRMPGALSIVIELLESGFGIAIKELVSCAAVCQI